MYPMDFEEFLWVIGNNAIMGTIRDTFERRNPLRNDIHRAIMKEPRVYMDVGGMPQAVEAYIAGESYRQIDRVKNRRGLLDENSCPQKRQSDWWY